MVDLRAGGLELDYLDDRHQFRFQWAVCFLVGATGTGPFLSSAVSSYSRFPLRPQLVLAMTGL